MSMLRRFDEPKATQAALRLLHKRGGRMSHMKLIKLLYLVERAALTRLGAPLSHDACVSMPYGPVPSATLDRINEPEMYAGGYWDQHIAPKQNHEVAPRHPDAPPPDDQLSRAEIALIDEVFERFGAMSRWELVDYTHGLPEWVDPQGSSLPIAPDDILRQEGYSDDQIAEVRAEWDAAAYAASLFS